MATPQVADQGEGEIHEPAREAAAVHQGAGGEEEGDGEQEELAGAIDDVLCQRRRREQRQGETRKENAEEQREGNRYPQQQGDDEAKAHDEAGGVSCQLDDLQFLQEQIGEAGKQQAERAAPAQLPALEALQSNEEQADRTAERNEEELEPDRQQQSRAGSADALHQLEGRE